MAKIYPVLLAGGTGSRLWPLSRKSYPKQFSKIYQETTLFQSSAKRTLSSDSVQFEPHITLTNANYRFVVGEQLLEKGIEPGPILIEPEAKNTAAAILAASIFAKNKDENAILFVTPSDHVIPDLHDFHNAVKIGLSHVDNGMIATFGVKPTRPETGYGYLELSLDTQDDHGVSDLIRFIEKPDEINAVQMFNAKNFLWNSGMFLFRAKEMINAFETFATDTLDLVSQSVDDAFEDLGFLRLAPKPWSTLENVSIDYAIMEKAQNLVAVPLTSKWTDLGGWDAVWCEGSKDSSGNVLSETAHAIGCKNSLLRSESKNQQLVGIGLDNIMAITMPDAVLVAHKDRAQDVKKAVSLLNTYEVDQAETFVKDHRPWGWFESLARGERFQVKRIFVKPGASLSLQSHKHRSEHWVVVVGTAKVTINNETKFVTEGQSVYVPLGVKHRLENTDQMPLLVIEVQIGSYLGEDDIIRYEDVYSRN